LKIGVSPPDTCPAPPETILASPDVGGLYKFSVSDGFSPPGKSLTMYFFSSFW
jgi:hypothetical protein